MKLLYQQDDCAPDSLESFHKTFCAITGYIFLDWYNNIATRLENDYNIIYSDGVYQIEYSADDPYWKLFQL